MVCFPIALRSHLDLDQTTTPPWKQCSSLLTAIHWENSVLEIAGEPFTEKRLGGWIDFMISDISWSDSSRKFWNGFQKQILAEARLARYNWWYLFIDLFSNEICYGESRTDIFIIPQLGVVCPRSSQVQPQTTGFLHQNGSKMRWDAGRRPDHFFRIIQDYPSFRKSTWRNKTKDCKPRGIQWISRKNETC